MSLSRQRCVRHPEREAVARCPSCGRDFCRECVIEHEGRMLCAACLNKRAAADAAPHGRLWRRLARGAGKGLAWAAAFLALVSFYVLVAWLANAVPPRFHDSTAFERMWGPSPKP